MKKARLIITWKCNRTCDKCVNNQPVAKNYRTITDLSELKDFEEISITGGEPMLNPTRLVAIITKIRKHVQTKVRIFLYTAWLYNIDMMRYVIAHVSGVHFTLHKAAKPRDVQDFQDFQLLIINMQPLPGKTFRVSIHHEEIFPVTIFPPAWHRVEIKSWEDDCKLPEGEELLVYLGDPETD